MDPARYWMLTRRKLGDQKAPVFTTPQIIVGGGGGSSASYYESWEERAFAEDSAGHLGGCIWPPRSYSCSFCGREFRSAQALGGHMNVHRRDRARLKLSGAAEDGGSGNHGMPPHQSYMIQPCPPQIGALQHAYSPNPSAPCTDTNPNSSVLPYPSRSLIQAAAAGTIWGKQVLCAPLASPSPGTEHGKKETFLGAAQLAQDHPRPAAKMCSNQESRAGPGTGRGELKLSVLGYRTRRDFEDDNKADDEKIVHVSRKRRRIDFEVNPLAICPSSSKHQQQAGDDDGDDNHRAKVLKLCPSSTVEELDLELRLGEAPKVK